MARKARNEDNSKHNNRRKHRRRRRYNFSYFMIIILIIIIPMGIYQFYVSNVDRTMDKLTDAIKTEDVNYLNKNTDRLAIILDVLKKSYSEDPQEQNEFLKNNFSNLDIKVLDKENKNLDKVVTVEVTNVNYIDVYDKLPEMKDEELYQSYMDSLSDSNQEKNTHKVKITLDRKRNGYKVYETREFINAILGGALDYAEKSN